MSAILQRFHQVANDALVKIGEQLWPDAKIALVIYTPGKPDEDIVLKDQGLIDDEVVSALRRNGLSIDGDNAYKRDLCDCIVGSLALGAQNSNPPPSDHWATRFWEIGREERELHEEMVATLRESRQVIAMALKTGAPDWFETDEKVANHVTVQRIDAVLAKTGA
ncbi:hypothetical protein [Pseudomonas fluorescens]|uniref:Uncharacterized protein n=1 Tax=Pseudomonas fluorescens TaxID=294 RepID=A0A5E7B6H7_PSEFL|nr:hypothetical protein [Pseudomonas fluorescens]VVN84364.1 hypothetical protein PS704_01353 [Pseudomonas fluorescens]